MASLRWWHTLRPSHRRHSSPDTELAPVPLEHPPRTRPTINTDLSNDPPPHTVICEGLARVKERTFVNSTKKWLWLKLSEQSNRPALLTLYQPSYKAHPERFLERMEIVHVERIPDAFCTLELDVLSGGKTRKLQVQFSVEWSLYVWLEEIYSRCPSAGVVDYDSFSHDMHVRIEEQLGGPTSFSGFPQSISDHFESVYYREKRLCGDDIGGSPYTSGESSADSELLTPESTFPPNDLHILIEEDNDTPHKYLPQDHIGFNPSSPTRSQAKAPEKKAGLEPPSRQSIRLAKDPPSADSSLRDLTKEIERLDVYPVASGGFSDIFQGHLTEHGKVRVVGIKVIRAVSHSRGVEKKIEKRLYSEINVWQRLHHPNVVELLGISRGYGYHPALVSWWYDNGHVMDYLESLGSSATLATRLKLLLDIARGLAYLHSFRLPVVHGDLKGSNVLVNAQGVAMLTDFGLSSIFEDLVGSASLTGSNSPGFSVRWLAVELLAMMEDDSSFIRFTPNTDVYSFGSTMLEILTGKVPYHNRQRDVLVIMDIFQGVRHRQEDTNISTPLWKVLENCWSDIPEHRPHSTQLVREVEHHYQLELQ